MDNREDAELKKATEKMRELARKKQGPGSKKGRPNKNEKDNRKRGG